MVSVPDGEWYRMIPSRFPPIDLFEELYDSHEEMEVAAYIEGLTSPRQQQALDNLRRVPASEWRMGPGASVIMAPFVYLSKETRFSDGTFGVYYAAHSQETAIAETSYHRARFLAATDQPSQEATMRVYSGHIGGRVADLRSDKYQNLLGKGGTYEASQSFARRLKESDIPGVLYPSVRHETGLCIGIFKPSLVAAPTQRMHLRYVYNGNTKQITHVYEIRALE